MSGNDIDMGACESNFKQSSFRQSRLRFEVLRLEY